VAGLAVGPEHLATDCQVTGFGVDVRHVRPVAERADERHERLDLLRTVCRILVRGLLLAVGEGHAAGGEVVVGGGLARVLQRGPTLALLVRDTPAVGAVAARAPGLVQLAPFGDQLVLVAGTAAGAADERRRHGRRDHQRQGQEHLREAGPSHRRM
jgi:hypothetical protein